MKDKFIVALKDTSKGDIRQGKILGKFRTLESAIHSYPSLVTKQGYPVWRGGIFQNNKLIY